MGVPGKWAALSHVVFQVWDHLQLVAMSSPRALLSSVSNQQKGEVSKEKVPLLLKSLTKSMELIS